MLLMFPSSITILTYVYIFTEQAMVKLQIYLLITLITFCILALKIFFKFCLCLYKLFINILLKFSSAHWTCNSNVRAMLKTFFIYTIILDNVLSLMLYPKFQTFYMIKVFTFLFTLICRSFICNLI